MLVSIRDLERGVVRFRTSFAPGLVDFSDDGLRQVSPLDVEGLAQLVNVHRGEIRIRGRLRVEMMAECDRCLEDAGLTVESDFDLVYVPARLVPEGDEIEIEGTALEVEFYEGEGVSLAGLVREQILLTVPMQRVCRDDCRGICPVCGGNRNLNPCSCGQGRADDRWAALRRL